MTTVDAGAEAEAVVEEQAGALAGRLFESMIAMVELETIYLGVKLGLYEALRAPATAGELSARTGLHPRYAREWLEQQAVAGLLTVSDGDAADRVYTLSPDMARR